MEILAREGGKAPAPTRVMRVRAAVMTTGARRGLAWKTRKTYAGWCGRFAATCATDREVLDPGQARRWLTELVEVQKLAYATQKQALNAVAFFYRDVCGREEVDLGVEFLKTTPRVPVVLSIGELKRFWDELPEEYLLPAELMFGSGVRVRTEAESEVASKSTSKAEVEEFCWCCARPGVGGGRGYGAENRSAPGRVSFRRWMRECVEALERDGRFVLTAHPIPEQRGISSRR